MTLEDGGREALLPKIFCLCVRFFFFTVIVIVIFDSNSNRRLCRCISFSCDFFFFIYESCFCISVAPFTTWVCVFFSLFFLQSTWTLYKFGCWISIQIPVKTAAKTRTKSAIQHPMYSNLPLSVFLSFFLSHVKLKWKHKGNVLLAAVSMQIWLEDLQ